jgi:hypothetical protein
VKSRLSIMSAAGFLDLLEVYTERHQTHSSIARRSIKRCGYAWLDALKHRLFSLEPAEPVSRWRAFVAGLWSVALVLALLLAPGCAQLAQQSASPPPTEPAYALLASKYLASVMKDRSAFEEFEISGLRWVHSLKGWSWLACVHFTDHGHVRSYALFIQDDTVVDGRYAVETDACGLPDLHAV